MTFLFPSQSPQMVMSWLQGVKPSWLGAYVCFFFVLPRSFWMLVTLDIIRFHMARPDHLCPALSNAAAREWACQRAERTATR